VGRIISADPLGHDGDENLYRYALNSPATLTDPTGEASARCHVLFARINILSALKGTKALSAKMYAILDPKHPMVQTLLDEINDINLKLQEIIAEADRLKCFDDGGDPEIPDAPESGKWVMVGCILLFVVFKIPAIP